MKKWEWKSGKSKQTKKKLITEIVRINYLALSCSPSPALSDAFHTVFHPTIIIVYGGDSNCAIYRLELVYFCNFPSLFAFVSVLFFCFSLSEQIKKAAVLWDGENWPVDRIDTGEIPVVSLVSTYAIKRWDYGVSEPSLEEIAKRDRKVLKVLLGHQISCVGEFGH
jgi:hypothetical protein